MNKISPILIALLILSLGSCRNSKDTGWLLDPEDFRKTIDGKNTELYRLSNEAGMEVYITNYGALVAAILVPDKDGDFKDVVLGYDNVTDYASESDPYFGAIAGRFAGELDSGKFELDGINYNLPVNEPINGNHLHGGPEGFSEQVWETVEATCTSISLGLFSADGHMGYPGNLEVTVTYSLKDDNTLQIVFGAQTDAPTIINLTNHSYFNLRGEGNGTILDQELMINADHYTPVNHRMVQTGEIAHVNGTPMDFTKPTKVGPRVNDDFNQLNYGNGYDHNWVLNSTGEELKSAASLYCKETGIFLEVLTTEPGLVFYCGNYLDGSLTGKSGTLYEHRSGLCLETQHYPNSPSRPNFPSTVLRPGEKYNQKTLFKFSVK